MKANKLFFVLAMLFAAFTTAQAQTVSPYSESFEGLNVSSADFHPKGWGHHYYKSYYSSYDATYTLVDGGHSGQYLNVVQYYPNYATYDDLLISPAVSGRVGLWVKSTGSAASVKFYSMTQSGSSWSKGSELTPDVAPALSGDFQEYVFNNVEAGTRIGIRGHQVGFDDFTAATAEVVLTRQLTLGSTSTTAPSTVGMNAENKYDLVVSVPLTNSGETDFHQGDENYSLTLRAGSFVDSRAIATVNIEDDLAAGATATRDYTFTVDGSDEALMMGQQSLYLFENIGNTSDFVQRMTFVPYKAQFALRSSETTSSYSNMSNGATLNFGSIQENTTRTLYIYNDGAAPLTLQVNVSDGFQSSVATGDVVPAGEHVAVTLTMQAGEFGQKAGTIVFGGNDISDFTLNLVGTVLDPDLWYEGFATGQKPTDMVNQSWTFTDSEGGYAIAQYSSAPTRLISPKLTVAEGQTLAANIARTSSSSWQTTIFKVYKSQDRNAAAEDWTEVGDYSSQAVYGSWTPITISGIEAGDWYLAFDGAYVYLDELYGFTKANVAHDLVVTAESLPTTGEVNTALSATLSVENLGSAEQADSYKAELLIDGVAVATAEAVEIAAGGTATYTFSYTPHATGNDLPVQIRLTSNSDAAIMAQSAQGTLTIAEETAKSEATIGTPGTTTQYRAPVYTYGKYSWSDIVYTNRIGMDAGAQVSKITFRGNNTAERTAQTIKVWIENTTLNGAASTWNDPTEEPTVELTNYVFPVGQAADMLVLDLSEAPFVYTGGNVRIRVKTVMTSANGSVNFLTDDLSGSARYDYESTDRTSTSLYNATAPVAFLNLVADPIVVKGQVTDKATSQPIEGVTVTVKSGDVEYYGTSDAQGSYTVNVMKNLPGYTVDVNHSGYFPYSEPVSLQGGDNTHDVALSEAKDFYIVSEQVPAEGTVNHALHATVTLLNANATPFEAGSYTVNLYVDGEKVASVPGETLAANDADLSVAEAQHTYTLDYTPHAAGSHEATIAIEWGTDNKTEGKAHTITVTDEQAVGIAQVGTPSGTGYNAPVFLQWESSATETVYDQSVINLSEGTQILSLTYKGYTTSNFEDVAMKVWLQNTDDAAGTVGDFDRDAMTLVYDGTKNIEAAGSSTDMVDLLTFTLDQPFVYTGQNLRVIVQEVLTGEYSACWFETDTNLSGQTSITRNGTRSEAAILSSSYRERGASPVLYVGYDNSRKITGTVRNSEDNRVVAGATVKAVSGDVLYTAVTDEHGQYALTIVQLDKQYTVTANHPDYGHSEPVVADLTDGDVEVNLSLAHTHFFIAGQVTDIFSHEPIEGASVIATSDNVIYTGTTDADGHYSLTIWELDRTYTLTVSATGYDVPEAEQVTITDASVLKDYALTPVHVAISGYVTDSHTGNGLPGVDITFTSEDGQTTYNATTDDEGAYEVTVYVMNTTYVASVDAVAGYEAYQDVDVTVDESSVTQDFHLVPLHAVISGTVTDAQTGQPVAGATVKAQSDDLENIYVGQTDAAGSYELTVWYLDHDYTMTVEADGYEAAEATVTAVAVGERTQDFTLTPDATTAIGRITTVTAEWLKGKAVYDLKGRRVNTDNGLRRGIYIVEGKKVAVK